VHGDFFWVFVEAVMEFRKVWVQILINGGARSTFTNQKPTYGQGYFRNSEELGANLN